MVNLEDEENPREEEYKPDGSYIPRILFTDKEGKVDGRIFNKARAAKHRHFYTTEVEIVGAMEKSLRLWDRIEL